VPRAAPQQHQEQPALLELEAEHSELETACRVLIDMLKYEIGLAWMSLPLRLQIEEVELLLGLTFVPVEQTDQAPPDGADDGADED
jgi:hypothetical protein